MGPRGRHGDGVGGLAALHRFAERDGFGVGAALSG